MSGTLVDGPVKCAGFLGCGPGTGWLLASIIIAGSVLIIAGIVRYLRLKEDAA